MNLTSIDRNQADLIIKEGNISVAPLIAREDNLFRFAVSRYVSPSYPGTEENYTDKILFEHFSGLSSGLNSTNSRIIWTIKILDVPIGFFVLTHKKSGSIKLAPCVFFPEYTNKGYGEIAFNAINEIYKNSNYKKLFTTIPTTKTMAISLAIKCGFTLEVVLKNHYSREYDEVVLSKKIESRKTERDSFMSIKHAPNESFVCRENMIFSRNEKEIVYNIKRGGSIKILKSDDDEIISDFSKKIIDEKVSGRKLFSTVSNDSNLHMFLDNKFVIEGEIYLPIEDRFYNIVSKRL